MLIDPNDEIGWQILMHRAYETALTNLVKRELEPCDTFVDIGANHGWFSLLAAAILHTSKGRVVAFEPQQHLAERLTQSCTINRFTNVEVIRAAAGDVNGFGVLQPGPMNFSGYARVTPKFSGECAIAILRLDGVLRKLSPMLVKIDVEGFEEKVLKGMGALLNQPLLRSIIVEVHPQMMAEQGDTPKELVALLTENGYSVFLVNMATTRSEGNILKPLMDRDLSRQHYHLFARRRCSAPPSYYLNAKTTR